jgi:hypothetical protein
MIKMLSSEEDKRSSELLRRKREKLKSRGECIPRKLKTLIFCSMNSRLGD